MKDWDAETAAALNDEPEPEAGPGPSGASDVREPEIQMPNIPAPPLSVIVVGSSAWDEPLVVQAALLGWANAHRDRSVILFTTGSPRGAELDAREFGVRSGWAVAEASPDRLLNTEATVSFAFIVPGSDAELLADELGLRRPLRKMTLESVTPMSRWNTW
jgi:hypothetical protein